MTRTLWQDKRTSKRNAVKLRYNYKGSYALSEIESIGEILIGQEDKKCNCEFTVFFKSGNKHKIDFDFDKIYKRTTKQGFFNKYVGLKPISTQYYFDNIDKIETLKTLESFRDTISKMWLTYLKSEVK